MTYSSFCQRTQMFSRPPELKYYWQPDNIHLLICINHCMSCSTLHTITWLSKWFHAVLPEFLGIKHKQVFPHFWRVHSKPRKSCFLLCSSRPKDQQKSSCLSLFSDLCAGVNTECFIMKSSRMLYCIFGAWLPVCSVQNSAVVLQHPPDIEVLVDVNRD